MGLQADEEAERLAHGQGLQEGARTGRGDRPLDGLAAKDDPAAVGGAPDPQPRRHAPRLAPLEVQDDVRRRPGACLLEAKGGVARRECGRRTDHDEDAETGGRQVRGCQRGLAVEQDAARGDAELAGTGDGCEEDLAGVAADGLSAERQSRISSTAST